jgi:hypothetical protein
VSIKVVVLDKPPPEPFTEIVLVPVGVLAAVLIVNVTEQVGLQEFWEKLEVALAGKPLAVNPTAWVEPAMSVAVIVFDPEFPWLTVILPELLKLKSKAGVVTTKLTEADLTNPPLVPVIPIA